MKRKPPPKYAPYGQWAAQATKVKLMVDNEGWGISDAVRSLVARKRYPDPDKAFRGIRAAYYALLGRIKSEAEEEKHEPFEI